MNNSLRQTKMPKAPWLPVSAYSAPNTIFFFG